MNTVLKSVFSIVEYTLALRGILQIPFVKDKRRWAASGALLMVFLLCENHGVLGENAVIYFMISNIIASALIFKGKISHMIVKYLCVFWGVCFITAPIDVVLRTFYLTSTNGIPYRYFDWMHEIFLTFSLIILAILCRKIAWWQEYIRNAGIKFYGIMLAIVFCAANFEGFVAMYGETMPKGVRIFFEIVCMCLVEFIGLFGIGLILLSRAKEQYHRESMLKSEYMEISKQYYQSLQESMREIRKIRHDINAHLEALVHFLQENRINEAIGYLEKVTKQMKKANIPVVDVGNEFAGAILSSERMKMPEDVTFSCEGRFPGNIQLSDYEVCTILSNLVSNAREACERIESKEKKISLKIAQNRERLVLVIENPVEWEVDVEHLGEYTTKEKDGKHGYGLQNVKEIVEKHNGEIHFEVAEGRFVAEVII